MRSQLVSIKFRPNRRPHIHAMEETSDRENALAHALSSLTPGHIDALLAKLTEVETGKLEQHCGGLNDLPIDINSTDVVLENLVLEDVQGDDYPGHQHVSHQELRDAALDWRDAQIQVVEETATP